MVARREAPLRALAGEIAVTGGKRPAVLPIDLSCIEGPQLLAEELTKKGWEPAILVNSAGFGLRARAADADRVQQLAIVDLNVRALTDLSLRWIGAMERHRGGIINVASVASFFPGPEMAVYYASKSYVLSFSEALHQELAPFRVKVTALCPGPVPTEFHARAGISARRLPRRLVRSAERVARDGYEGFIRGQRVVIPGFANKMVTALPRLIPCSLMLFLGERNQLPPSDEEPGAQ